MQEKIFTLKMNGYCCSQIIMEIGLELMDRENPDLVEAMAGLCDGAKCGRICGVVSAANCLMYLADAKNAENEFIPEYGSRKVSADWTVMNCWAMIQWRRWRSARCSWRAH